MVWLSSPAGDLEALYKQYEQLPFGMGAQTLEALCHRLAHSRCFKGLPEGSLMITLLISKTVIEADVSAGDCLDQR